MWIKYTKEKNGLNRYLVAGQELDQMSSDSIPLEYLITVGPRVFPPEETQTLSADETQAFSADERWFIYKKSEFLLINPLTISEMIL